MNIHAIAIHLQTQESITKNIPCPS